MDGVAGRATMISDGQHLTWLKVHERGAPEVDIYMSFQQGGLLAGKTVWPGKQSSSTLLGQASRACSRFHADNTSRSPVVESMGPSQHPAGSILRSQS